MVTPIAISLTWSMSRTITPNAPGHILQGQSMAATFVSPVVDTWAADGVSWEGAYTGTPTGTFTIEASNQYDVNTNPTPTFVAMPAPTPAFPAPAGAGGQFIVTTPGPAAGGGAGRFQRLRFTRSAGTGSMDLWVCGCGKT